MTDARDSPAEVNHSATSSLPDQALQEFTIFPNLPIELRITIWRFSLPARIVPLIAIDSNFMTAPFQRSRVFYTNVHRPTAFRVCKESRKEALLIYTSDLSRTPGSRNACFAPTQDLLSLSLCDREIRDSLRSNSLFPLYPRLRDAQNLQIIVQQTPSVSVFLPTIQRCLKQLRNLKFFEVVLPASPCTCWIPLGAGTSYDRDLKTIDQYVMKLRKKLEHVEAIGIWVDCCDECDQCHKRLPVKPLRDCPYKLPPGPAHGNGSVI